MYFLKPRLSSQYREDEWKDGKDSYRVRGAGGMPGSLQYAKAYIAAPDRRQPFYILYTILRDEG